jgi:hypothetical protein
MLESGLNENNNSFLKILKEPLKLRTSKTSIKLARAPHSEEKEKTLTIFAVIYILYNDL